MMRDFKFQSTSTQLVAFLTASSTICWQFSMSSLIISWLHWQWASSILGRARKSNSEVVNLRNICTIPVSGSIIFQDTLKNIISSYLNLQILIFYMTQYEIVFQPKGSKDPKTIHQAKDTLLSALRSGDQAIASYLFLDKTGSIIPEKDEGKYKIEEVLTNEKQLLMSKKQQKKDPEDPKNEKQLFRLKTPSSSKVKILASKKDVLSNIRDKQPQLLLGFLFIDLKGDRISSSLEKDTTVGQICNKDIIKVVPQKDKTDKEKKQEIKQQQTRREEKINEAMKIAEGMKSDKTGMKQKMANMQIRLRELGSPVNLDQLSEEKKLSNVISILQGQLDQSKEVLEYAKRMEDKSQADLFEDNQRILPTIYATKKKASEVMRIVNFEKTDKTTDTSKLKGFKKSLIVYKLDQAHFSKSFIDSSSQYQFKGASLDVQAVYVSAKVQYGDKQQSSGEKIVADKGVKKNQVVHQLFYGFQINNVVSFHADEITLKNEVVERFQEIVSQYQGNPNQQKLKKNLQLFMDKYGIGISSSQYFLGGVFMAQIKYKFYGEKNSKQVTDIMSKQSASSLGVGVGVSFGFFSAGISASARKETQSSSSHGSNSQDSTQIQEYTSKYDRNSRPLSCIVSVDQWMKMIQTYPHIWTVVGHEGQQTLLLSDLLRSQNNSRNFDQKFVACKQKVLQRFQIMGLFKIQFEHSQHFQVRKSLLTMLEYNQMRQIIGKHPFPLQDKTSYSIQILRSEEMEIGLGICCESCKGNEYSRPKNNDCIYYHLAGRGTIEVREKSIEVGVIIKQCNVIQVQVDTAKRMISWFVQDNLVGSVQIPQSMLKDRVYPYLHMFTRGDKIKFN